MNVEQRHFLMIDCSPGFAWPVGNILNVIKQIDLSHYFSAATFERTPKAARTLIMPKNTFRFAWKATSRRLQTNLDDIERWPSHRMIIRRRRRTSLLMRHCKLPTEFLHKFDSIDQGLKHYSKTLSFPTNLSKIYLQSCVLWSNFKDKRLPCASFSWWNLTEIRVGCVCYTKNTPVRRDDTHGRRSSFP